MRRLSLARLATIAPVLPQFPQSRHASHSCRSLATVAWCAARSLGSGMTGGDITILLRAAYRGDEEVRADEEVKAEMILTAPRRAGGRPV